MTTTEDKVPQGLDELLGQFVNDLGATASACNVVIGDRLGLYRALAEAGPLTSSELADYTGTSERYVREWLPGQAAGGIVSYESDKDQYSLSAAQAFAFADPDGLSLPGAFEMALGCLADEAQARAAFRTGLGIGWGDHQQDVFTGCERFFRPGYSANLVDSWIPAIDGLDALLHNGTTVADVGCGLGSSTQILARTYRESTIRGFDNHPRSIELARDMAARAHLSDRCEFSVAAAQTFPGADYGLVTSFDCLHDMGDSNRCRAECQSGAGRPRSMDDRGAVRGRLCGGESQPGRSHVLLVLHPSLRSARHLGGF